MPNALLLNCQYLYTMIFGISYLIKNNEMKIDFDFPGSNRSHSQQLLLQVGVIIVHVSSNLTPKEMSLWAEKPSPTQT